MELWKVASSSLGLSAQHPRPSTQEVLGFRVCAALGWPFPSDQL